MKSVISQGNHWKYFYKQKYVWNMRVLFLFLIYVSILGSYKTKDTCCILCVARTWLLIAYASVQMLCKFVTPPNIVSSEDVFKIYPLTILCLCFASVLSQWLAFTPSAPSGLSSSQVPLPLCCLFLLMTHSSVIRAASNDRGCKLGNWSTGNLLVATLLKINHSSVPPHPALPRPAFSSSFSARGGILGASPYLCWNFVCLNLCRWP